jgi:hypothetical protein
MNRYSNVMLQPARLPLIPGKSSLTLRVHVVLVTHVPPKADAKLADPVGPG